MMQQPAPPPAEKKRKKEKDGSSSSSDDSSSSDLGNVSGALGPAAAMAAMAAMWHPGAASSQMGMPPAGGDSVADFLSMSNVSAEAAQRMRQLAPHLQQVVLKRGPLHDARNPTAVLLARIRDAELGSHAGYPEPGAGGGGRAVAPPGRGQEARAEVCKGGHRGHDQRLPALAWLRLDDALPAPGQAEAGGQD
ncbi:unnamed protein product [Prorocentrum cordatum]|uniref:Uncharacterized protein n=1 Tax=Prorocentrum cordatum TaxID=2364126 RepID=A0ABN9QEN1_9DINO|nr:unnamed protein product [Polarella glacialis]